jgi:hypothetical protein
MPKQINTDKQKEVLDKIYKILNINEGNKTFSLKEMDENVDKQNAILGLEEEIKEGFCYSKWTCFKKEMSRKWLSFVKYVVKDMGVEMVNSRKSFKKDDGKFTVDIVYIFI